MHFDFIPYNVFSVILERATSCTFIAVVYGQKDCSSAQKGIAAPRRRDRILSGRTRAPERRRALRPRQSGDPLPASSRRCWRSEILAETARLPRRTRGATRNDANGAGATEKRGHETVTAAQRRPLRRFARRSRCSARRNCCFARRVCCPLTLRRSLDPERHVVFGRCFSAVACPRQIRRASSLSPRSVCRVVRCAERRVPCIARAGSYALREQDPCICVRESPRGEQQRLALGAEARGTEGPHLILPLAGLHVLIWRVTDLFGRLNADGTARGADSID